MKDSNYKKDQQQKAIHNLKLPPYSLEAEQAVLGSIMIRPDAHAEIADIISENSFYSEKHKKIFIGINSLMEKGDPVDYLSLKTVLDNMGYLDQIGGASYLAELIQMVPSSSNIEYYARILEKKFMMRHLINASENIGNLAYGEQGDLENILDQAEKEIFTITQKNTKSTITSIKEGLIETWDNIDKIHNSGDELRGVPTGFVDLDNKLS